MKVILVGAGPGDPGLITVKGAKALAQADVVVYDALANSELLAFAKPDAERIYVGKIAGSHALPQPEINSLLVSKARQNGGSTVVRLKGGDPYIFGRGGEEAEYLAENAIPFEEVPGVSSAIAAPAYAGIPLTHRNLVSSVSIITGHENPEKGRSVHDWQAFVKSGSTLVFVMGIKNLAAICANLIQAGMAEDMPAAIIYRGTTPMQRSLRATVATLAARAAENGFSNPSVVVIGKVAALGDQLDWFSQKPLLGRRIVVTRAREQASDMLAQLQELGAQTVQCPTIRVNALADYTAADNAIASLHEYAWLIFTSVNGVKFFWQRLHYCGLDTRATGKAKIAAIGPATASALARQGIKADLVPKTYVAESVAAELTALDNLAGKRILLPRAAKARNVLPDELKKAGALVDIVPLYETRPDGSSASEVRELIEKGQLDCISFGSSSTVENFLELVPAALLLQHPQTVLAAIGPVTAATLRKHGLSARIEPSEYTIPGLINAICDYFNGPDAGRLSE